MASLKLFRSTGFSSVFDAGETRVAVHPSWVVLAVSVWVGFACNVQLWRELSGRASHGATGLEQALLTGAFIAAASALFLCILGWRTTVKPAATVLVVVAALSACSIWGQAMPVDASLAERKLSTLVVPPWALLFRWEVCVLFAVLAVAPVVWIWHTRTSRFTGPRQLRVNALGALAAAAVLACSGFLLSRGFA